MRYLIPFVLFTISCISSLFSQNISNVEAYVVGDSVLVKYNLNDPSPERTYSIRLYGIFENDTSLLRKTSGSVGDSIQTGEHEILWNAIEELGRFRGDMKFMVRALPAFYITNPEEGQIVKRTNPITFAWYGANSDQDALLIELYQYDEKLDTLAQVSYAGKYTWKVPRSLKPDKGYRIKVTGTERTGIESFSNSFTVKRKIPVYWIVGPALVAVGGVTALLIANGNKKQPLPPPLLDPDGE